MGALADGKETQNVESTPKALEEFSLAFSVRVWDVDPAPCTLHPAPCTLHPAPCTLHPAPCTLHPEPCTLVRVSTVTVNDVTHSSASLRPCVMTPTMLCTIPAERERCSGVRVQGSGCRVQGAWCRVQGSGERE